MVREDIDFKQPIQEIIVTMAEGNPGAARVLSQIAYTDPTLLVTLDDMNVRGVQVWIGYKDYCHEKLERFIRAIRERNNRMLATINQECNRLPSSDFRPKAVKAVGHHEREEIP